MKSWKNRMKGEPKPDCYRVPQGDPGQVHMWLCDEEIVKALKSCTNANAIDAEFSHVKDAPLQLEHKPE